ncbi:MAG: signal peptidase I [Candidatus Methanofastidiosia archaeon]|jgi:signal peptidase
MSVSSDDVKKNVLDVAFALCVFLLIQGILYGVLGVFPAYRVVNSGSMEPVFYEGDVVFIKKVDASTLEVGDIIVFKARRGKTPIVHRIVEVIEENGNKYFVTQGDSNAFTDSYYDPGVPGDRIIGTPVFTIPRIGLISVYLRRLIL